MGYRIEYGELTPAPRRTSPGSRRFALLLTAFFLTFLILTQLFWPAGAEKIRQFCLPGDADVTARAASALIEDLKGGMAVSDAVTAFCEEILDSGKDPG